MESEIERVPKIAINGFGRIGRTITRLAKMRGHFNIVAVNDLASPEALQYAFKYDSIHGIYPGSVDVNGDIMNIDGDPFRILCESDPGKLQAFSTPRTCVSSSSARHGRAPSGTCTAISRAAVTPAPPRDAPPPPRDRRRPRRCTAPGGGARCRPDRGGRRRFRPRR